MNPATRISYLPMHSHTLASLGRHNGFYDSRGCSTFMGMFGNALAETTDSLASSTASPTASSSPSPISQPPLRAHLSITSPTSCASTTSAIISHGFLASATCSTKKRFLTPSRVCLFALSSASDLIVPYRCAWRRRSFHHQLLRLGEARHGRIGLLSCPDPLCVPLLRQPARGSEVCTAAE